MVCVRLFFVGTGCHEPLFIKLFFDFIDLSYLIFPNSKILCKKTGVISSKTR